MKQTNGEVEHPYHAHVRNCLDCSGAYGHCSEGLSLLRTGEVKAAQASERVKWEVNHVSNGWLVGKYNGLEFKKAAKFYNKEQLDRFLALPECPACAYTASDLASLNSRADIASKPDSEDVNAACDTITETAERSERSAES